MKQKGFTPILLVILIAIVAVFGAYYFGFKKVSVFSNLVHQSDTPIPNISSEDNQSYVYFNSDQKMVSRYNFANKLVEKVVDAESYDVSDDGQWLAYTSGYDSNTEMTIFIKNLKSGDVTSFDSKTPLIRSLVWSTKANYLVSDSGTGPEGSMVVYARDGKHLATFGTSSLVWFKNDSNLFYTLKQKIDPERPWEGGYGSGVGLIDLSSGQKQTILSADAKNDYSPESLEGDNVIIYHSSANSQADWENQDKIDKSYLSIDAINIAQPPKPIPTPISVMQESQERQKIKSSGILDLTAKNDYDWFIYSNPKDANQVLVTVYPGSDVYSTDIYLVDVNNIQNFKHIGNGAWPKWR